jgi:hypothetical protein
MTPLKRSYHPSWKVAVGVAVPLLLLLGLMGWLLAPTREAAYLNTALLIGYCSIGWFAGMLFSPDSSLEEKKFGSIGKGVSLFISGYVVSKIDPLIAWWLRPETISQVATTLAVYRVVAAISAILLTGILAYVVRVYAFTVEADGRPNREMSQARLCDE